MNKEYICEKCGTEMVPIDKKIPVGLTCPNCGWGWATTYIDPIIEDDIKTNAVAPHLILRRIRMRVCDPLYQLFVGLRLRC